ncbi:MAG: dTMP kinase, partial [Patescibacteria group bacterium]
VADRSFITSMAFQGYGRDVGVNTILKINETAIDDILPDLVVLLDLDIDIALSRVFDQEGDKFERMGKEFFEKVREGYEEI